MASPSAVKRAAQISGVALLLTLLAIEIALELDRTPSNSFSYILRAWAVVGLAAPFGWGTLAGHFFHPVDELKSLFPASMEGTKTLVAAVSPILVLIGVDIVLAKAVDDFTCPRWTSPLMLLLGLVWGALFWPVTMRAEGAPS